MTNFHEVDQVHIASEITNTHPKPMLSVKVKHELYKMEHPFM